MGSFELYKVLSENGFIFHLTIIAVTIVSYFIFRRNPKIKSHLDKFKGPTEYPLVGASYHFLRPQNEYIPMINSWVEEYGPKIGIWLGPFNPFVFIAEASAVEKVISTTNHIDKAVEYNLLHDWLGTGLLTASRKTWSARRKLLTPSFHFKILEDFVPIFNEQATVFVQSLEKELSIGKEFDIYPYITNFTLDVICETAMGIKINAQTSSKNKKYVEAVYGQTSIILDKFTKPWLNTPILCRLTSAYKLEKQYLSILKGFTAEVIQARKLERKQHLKETNDQDTSGLYGKQRKAFLDLLLDTSENGNVLSDIDIRDEVDTFMFEGHDTTGVNLGWTILLLGANMKCQEKVQQELDEIFSDDPERDVTVADVAQMKYLDCCVKETLRLYPSVPFIMRKVDFDIPLDDGKIIPKGCTAMVGIYHLHRNPEYFPEPHEFKPERFSVETSIKRHPYAMIAFSAGPRNCIGQKFALLEEKIALAKLFRKYRVVTQNETMKNVNVIPDVVLRSGNGIHVSLYKRV